MHTSLPYQLETFSFQSLVVLYSSLNLVKCKCILKLPACKTHFDPFKYSILSGHYSHDRVMDRNKSLGSVYKVKYIKFEGLIKVPLE